MAYCQGLLLLFSLWPKLNATRGRFVSLLGINFYNISNKRKWLSTKKVKSRRYPAESITDVDYADYLALLVNIPAEAESLLHNLEQAAGSIGPVCTQIKQI